MPKVDITKTSGGSEMPEFKKAPAKKPQPVSKMPNLNASALHHNGDEKVVVTETTKTIESEDSIEVEKTVVIEEVPEESETSEVKINDLEPSKEEPELIDDLDNFEEKEEKKDFDLELTEEKEEMTKKTKKEKKKSSKKLGIIGKIIYAIFAISGIIFLATILSLGVLPKSYIATFIGIFALILLIFGFFTLSKKLHKIAKIICIIFEVILSAIFIIGLFFINETTGFLSGILANNYQIEEYYVIVKKDSKFEKVEDLNDHSIATYTDISENYQKALAEFAEKSTAEQKSYIDFSDASFAFLNSESDALLLKGSLKSTVEEIISDYNTQNPDNTVPAFNENNIRILYTIEIKVEVERTEDDDTDLTTEPFNVFISGIDTFGDISLVSRSDVNMIATVNPKEHKILLTSIPRDYYVQLHGTTGLKDKLTHAGIYGVDMSRQTLEDLFDTKIRYYVRVNFSSVINIVDAIGGININSDLALNLAPAGGIGKYCSYAQGDNHVDGDCALRFARERHSYADGDNHRIKNQQEVLDAIIKKASSSKTIISNYSELLSALNGNVESNVPTNQIYKLVQAQLDTMPSWTVERITVAGTGDHNVTYSIPSQSLYVMIPDEETVETAKKKINETLGIAEPEPEPEEIIEPVEEPVE